MLFHSFSILAVLLLAALAPLAASPPNADWETRLASRRVIERVYHDHRSGTHEPFELTLPDVRLRALVEIDLKKETLLARQYRIPITETMIAAEAERIQATTRAPDILANIKTALNNDPARFAESFVKPILVDRTLRESFANDDAVHAPARRAAEQARARLLSGQPVETLRDIVWQLGPRHATNAPTPALASPSSAASAAYVVEATAQIAQVIASPTPDADAAPPRDSVYFEDLDPELRQVLSAQLRHPGDVSALIETSTVFLVFVAGEKTATTFAASVFTLPKRSYETWIAEPLAPTP